MLDANLIRSCVRKAQECGWTIQSYCWVTQRYPRACCPLGAVLIAHLEEQTLCFAARVTELLPGATRRDVTHFIMGFDGFIAHSDDDTDAYRLGCEMRKEFIECSTKTY